MACGVFIAVLIAAFIVLYQVRKKTDPRRKGSDDYSGLTMESIDNMYDAGMISREEFTSLRRALLGLPGEKKTVTSDNDSDILNNSDDNENKDDLPDKGA